VKLFASKTFSVGLAALACLLTAPARAGITYEMVTVGNAGNAYSTSGYGAVAYDYQIGKYEVTVGQYTAFLNAVAATDTYSLYFNERPFIRQIGSPGSYTYDAIVSANIPITGVSWGQAARFANWMMNGQGGADTTSTGAYTLYGQTNGPARAINPGATFHIPTHNEWYKAAFYSPIKGSTGGYYSYATQSDTAPGNHIGGGANQANWFNGVYSVTQSSQYLDPKDALTDVGAFSGSASFYGTYDQAGNAWEWTDLDGLEGPARPVIGGSYNSGSGEMSSSYFDPIGTNSAFNGLGFRLAGPAASGVPEIDPSSFGSALALVLGSLGLFERRRAR